jgi:hypothetical protein
MHYYCTYFDQNYLPRALALYHSLRSHGGDFRLWALCMDAAAYDAVVALALPGLDPIALEDFERGDTALAGAKAGRSRAEYFFTCTPSLPLYVLEHWPEVDLVTYLDSDLFFYSHPAPVFDELKDASVGIVGHRFSRANRDRQRFGIYTVGWVSFRRDEQGLACLRWWRERCIEWCFDRVEEHRYADQKYLDDWPRRFDRVRAIEHRGANLAPWNVASYRISERDGRVWVDDQPLVFFHFQGFQQLAPWLYNSNFGLYFARPSSTIRRAVIGPYIAALREATRASVLRRGVRPYGSGRGALTRRIRRLARLALGVLTQEYVVVVNGRVL